MASCFSSFISFRLGTNSSWDLPFLVPFHFKAMLRVRFLLFSFCRSLRVFTCGFPIIQINDTRVLISVGQDFEIVVISKVVRYNRLPTYRVRVPMERAGNLRHGLRFVVSLFGLLIRTIRLKSVLSRTNRTCNISVLILFREGTSSVTVLPNFVMFYLRTTDRISNFIFT